MTDELTNDDRINMLRTLRRIDERVRGLHAPNGRGNLKTKKATDEALALMVGASIAWGECGEHRLEGWMTRLAFVLSVRDATEITKMIENVRSKVDWIEPAEMNA